jgi:hypothetical protein
MLGVSRTATSQEIKAAFKRRTKSCYPDPSLELRFPCEKVKELQQVTVAYDVLGDEEKRRAYDNKSFSDDGKRGNQLTAVVCGCFLSFGAMLARGPPPEKRPDRGVRGHGTQGKVEGLRAQGKWKIAPETHEEINWLEGYGKKMVYTPKTTLNKTTGRVSKAVLVTANSRGGDFETRHFHLEREDHDGAMDDPAGQPVIHVDWTEF